MQELLILSCREVHILNMIFNKHSQIEIMECKTLQLRHVTSFNLKEQCPQ